MKEAYDVLADPRRRELYDQLGETGLRMMEDPASLSPEKVQQLLSQCCTVLCCAKRNICLCAIAVLCFQ
jgi:curved DNA-binding protein CbpA